jgi:hypothetical protein
MAQGIVHSTPTGYGLIKVSARKQVVVPEVNAPSLVPIPRSNLIQVNTSARRKTISRKH